MVVTATIEEAQPVYGSWIPRAEKPQHRGAESIARRPRSMLQSSGGFGFRPMLERLLAKWSRTERLNPSRLYRPHVVFGPMGRDAVRWQAGGLEDA